MIMLCQESRDRYGANGIGETLYLPARPLEPELFVDFSMIPKPLEPELFVDFPPPKTSRRTISPPRTSRRIDYDFSPKVLQPELFVDFVNPVWVWTVKLMCRADSWALQRGMCGAGGTNNGVSVAVAVNSTVKHEKPFGLPHTQNGKQWHDWMIFEAWRKPSYGKRVHIWWKNTKPTSVTLAAMQILYTPEIFEHQPRPKATLSHRKKYSGGASLGGRYYQDDVQLPIPGYELPKTLLDKDLPAPFCSKKIRSDALSNKQHWGVLTHYRTWNVLIDKHYLRHHRKDILNVLKQVVSY